MKNLRQISIRQPLFPPLDFRLFFRQKMKKQANNKKKIVEKTQKTGNNDEAAGHLAVLDIPSLFCKTAETSNDQCKTIRKNSKSCAPTPTKPPGDAYLSIHRETGPMTNQLKGPDTYCGIEQVFFIIIHPIHLFTICCLFVVWLKSRSLLLSRTDSIQANELKMDRKRLFRSENKFHTIHQNEKVNFKQNGDG